MGRRDGKLVKNLDPLHVIMPLLYQNRCDNEAFISERIDLTKINEYLAKKNEALSPEENGEVFKYTIFHFLVGASMKMVKLRPKMNWFVANGRIYERNDITAAFIVKKKFSETSEEALAIIKAKDDDNLDSIHEKLRHIIYDARSDKLDESSEAMGIVSKLPFFLVRGAVWAVRKLDKYGKVPQALIATDPNYSSIFLSNLGSIKLNSGYHHLTNWGTNSLFIVVGERKVRPFYNDDGTYEMRDSVDIGITIDERIADGYYYAKSLRLVRKLIENPELLDQPLNKEIDY